MPSQEQSPDFSFLNALSGGKDSATSTPENKEQKAAETAADLNPVSQEAAENAVTSQPEPAANQASAEVVTPAAVVDDGPAWLKQTTSVTAPVSQPATFLTDATDVNEVATSVVAETGAEEPVPTEEANKAIETSSAVDPQADEDPADEEAVDDQQIDAEFSDSEPVDETTETAEYEVVADAVIHESEEQAETQATAEQVAETDQMESAEDSGSVWDDVAEPAPEAVAEATQSTSPPAAESGLAWMKPSGSQTGQAQTEKVSNFLFDAPAPTAADVTALAASPEAIQASAALETTSTAADGPAHQEQAGSVVNPQVESAAQTVTTASIPVLATVAAATLTAAATSAPQKNVAAATEKPALSKADPAEPQQKGMSSIILLSYASAVTLFCVYLLFQSLAGKPHDLESLPDLKPPMKEDGEIAYRLVIESASLPAGHTLELGKSKRYGNLKVTPLRVEQAPLQFSHYTGDASKKREATKPVLKLWLKFENVSENQKFAPIDRQLMLTKIVDSKRPEFLRSNQWLSPVSHKGDLEKTSLIYDLELFSDWNFANIQDNPVIGPGESLEVYFPSAEVETMDVSNPLLWRVHFRKGYHPESRRGVTTLIEVKVNPKDIQAS